MPKHYSHWSSPLIGKGFLPFTAKFQSASKSSPFSLWFIQAQKTWPSAPDQSQSTLLLLYKSIEFIASATATHQVQFAGDIPQRRLGVVVRGQSVLDPPALDVFAYGDIAA
jgi:hypothetical protein